MLKLQDVFMPPLGNVDHANTEFGKLIALSKDGSTLVVGHMTDAYGTVDVYRHDGSNWKPYASSSNLDLLSIENLTISDDGSTFAFVCDYGVLVFQDLNTGVFDLIHQINVNNMPTDFQDFTQTASLSSDGSRVAVGYTDVTGKIGVAVFQQQTHDSFSLKCSGVSGFGGTVDTMRGLVALQDDQAVALITRDHGCYLITFDYNNANIYVGGVQVSAPVSGVEYRVQNFERFNGQNGLMLCVQYKDNGDNWRQEVCIADRAYISGTFKFVANARAFDYVNAWNDNGWGLSAAITEQGDMLAVGAKSAAISNQSADRGSVLMLDMYTGIDQLSHIIDAPDDQPALPVDFGQRILVSANLRHMIVATSQRADGPVDTGVIYCYLDEAVPSLVPRPEPQPQPEPASGVTMRITRNLTDVREYELPADSTLAAQALCIPQSNTLADDIEQEGKLVSRTVSTNVDVKQLTRSE